MIVFHLIALFVVLFFMQFSIENMTKFNLYHLIVIILFLNPILIAYLQQKYNNQLGYLIGLDMVILIFILIIITTTFLKILTSVLHIISKPVILVIIIALITESIMYAKTVNAYNLSKT